jgi:hypothetical protein
MAGYDILNTDSGGKNVKSHSTIPMMHDSQLKDRRAFEARKFVDHLVPLEAAISEALRVEDGSSL